MKRNLRLSISNNDNSRQKRIKVGDLDRDGSLTCGRDSSPVSLKERHATYPNNTKTSEFAFFKKFKEDANHRFSSLLPRQKELQSKKFNSSNCFKERASPVDKRCKDFTPHHLVENVTSVNCYSLHLPLGNSSKISEVDVKHAHKSVKDIQSKQRNVENDGTLYIPADIFSRKRQKLRQFVQNTSIHGTGESYEKGNGVISILLSRLIPESNQYKFNNNLEKLQRLPERCCPRLEYEHNLNNSSSPFHLNESRGRAISHADFSTYSDDNNFLVKYRTEFDCDVERERTLLGSPFSAVVENCRSLISSFFEPQYGLYDQGEHLHLRKQELEPLLLGWDTNDVKDESSSQLTELNCFAESPISSADDHQLNLHKNFGAVALCTSPFPSSYRRNIYSMPYSSLACYQIHGLSWQNVGKEEDMDATFNNMHLNFSSVPKCLHQYNNYVDDGSSHDFCGQNVDWLMNNVSDDEHQNPSVESLCASGIVFDFGQNYLSGLKEQCQTAYHTLKHPLDENEMKSTALVNEECHNDSADEILADYWPPFFIQPELFFQEGKVCSILPDKLSWGAS